MKYYKELKIACLLTTLFSTLVTLIATAAAFLAFRTIGCSEIFSITITSVIVLIGQLLMHKDTTMNYVNAIELAKSAKK